MADGAVSPAPTLTPEALRTLVDVWLRDRRPLAEAAAAIGITPADVEQVLRDRFLSMRLKRQEYEHEARRLRMMLRAVARLDPLAGGGVAALVEFHESEVGTTTDEGLPQCFAGVAVSCATSDERWLTGAVDDALERFCDLINPRREHRATEGMTRTGVTADDPEPAQSERPVYTGAPWRIEGEGSVLRLGDFDQATGRGRVLFEVSASLEAMQSSPFGRMVMTVEGRAMPEPVVQEKTTGADPRQTALQWGTQ